MIPVLVALTPFLASLAIVLLLGQALYRRYPLFIKSSMAGAALAYLGLTSCLALFALILSPFHGISSFAYRLFFVCAIFGAGWFRMSSPKANPIVLAKPTSLSVYLLYGTIFTVLLGATCWTLVCPVTVWDSLSYHLPMAATYLQQGSIEPFATQIPRSVVSPHVGELQATAFLAVSRNDIGIELPGVLGLFGFLLITGSLLSPRHNHERSKKTAALGMLALLTASQLMTTSVSGKNDTISCCFILGAFWLALRSARETNIRYANLNAALAGACIAMALGTKLTAVYGAIGLAAAILIHAKRGNWRWRQTGYALSGGILPFLLFVVWKSIHAYQSFGTLIGGSTQMHSSSNDLATSAPARFLQNAQLLWDVFLRPLTWGLRRPNAEHAHLGYFFLFSIPIAFIVVLLGFRSHKRRKRSGWRTHGLDAFVFIVAYAGAMLFSHKQVGFAVVRFLLPLLPIFTLIILAGRRNRSGLHKILAPILIALALFTCGRAYWGPETKAHLSLALEAGHPVSFGQSPLGANGVGNGYNVLQQNAKNGDRILYLGSNNSLWYPCFSPNLDREVFGVRDVADLKTKLQHQPEWVIVEQDANPDLKAELISQINKSIYQLAFKSSTRILFCRKIARD